MPKPPNFCSSECAGCIWVSIQSPLRRIAERFRWLYMRVALFIFTLLALCGCDPVAMKRVNLGLVAPAGSPPSEMAASVTVESSEIQQALEIIDAVVHRRGLVSGGEYPDHQANVIRWYGLAVPQAQAARRSSLTCRIYLKGRELEVLFAEFPKASSSPDVVEMQDEIRAQFVKTFGKERVR